MTSLNNIIKRALSLIKAHVQYSQSLAAEFSHLTKDYEELVEAPEVIELEAQEKVDLETVCAVFEELMDNEPIDVLRALWPYGVIVDAEEEVIGNKAVEESNENAVRYPSTRARKRILSRHTNVHSTKKIFECSICYKCFGKKCHLNDHTRIHTEEKPFQCTICSKSFFKKGVLDRHTKVHTGEKPHECTVCGKRFIQKSNLNIHVRVHK
jgi:hypothetical protein